MINILGNKKDLDLYNKEGMEVYTFFTDSSGVTWERYRDKWGNELSVENSDGFTHKYTRDHKGTMLTYTDSNGVNTSCVNIEDRELTTPEYTMPELLDILGTFKLIIK